MARRRYSVRPYAGSVRRRLVPHRRALRFEPLEDRRLLAVFTVSSLNDAGAGSLREAITLANGNGSADTIDFAVIGTIDIHSQLPTITDDLMISGPGIGLLNIDAQLGGDGLANGNGWRIFEVDDGTGGLIDVAIRGLTLTGGDVAGGGGAIFTLENLTLASSVLSGNRAFRGGGIYSADGTTEIIHSTLSGNIGANRGGGIDNQGIAQVTSSTFSENYANYGGGIYNNSSGTLTLTNTTISGNTSSRGGGIHNVGTASVTSSTITENTGYLGGGGIYGSATLDHSIVSGNEDSSAADNLYGAFHGDYNLVGSGNFLGGSGNIPSDSPGLGPLAYNGGSTPTHALLVGSQAIDAGGTTAQTNDQRGAPFLRTFNDPVASGSGVDIGAFELQPFDPSLFVVTTAVDEFDSASADISLREAIDAANISQGADTITFDAAVFATPQTIALGSTLPTISDELTITGPGRELLTIDAGNGVDNAFNTGDGFRILNVTDGVSNNDIDVMLSGITFTGGDALGNGGAIFSLENLTIHASAIVENATRGVFNSGGGVFAGSGGILTLTETTVSGNAALNTGGGISNSTTVYLINSVVSLNSASHGGGIHSSNALYVDGSTISGNMAGVRGGGILNNTNFDLTVTDSLVSGNSADDGGGIYNIGILNVYESTLSGNMASSAGGGVTNYREANFTGSTITNNMANQTGGGIFNGALSFTNVNSSTLWDNTAQEGGGIYNRGTATITSSTISENTAVTSGGGIRNIDQGTVNVNGSTITANTADSGGGIDTRDAATFETVLNITGSIVAGNIASSSANVASFGLNTNTFNLIDVDPNLDPLADNGGPTQTHALLPGSPAIDAGDPDIVFNPAEHDQRGAPFTRVHGGRIDIGAFELQSAGPALPGDYNENDTVDAADYVLWRKTLGQTDMTPFSGADGNGDGDITQADFGVWRANFGNMLPPLAAGSGAAATAAIDKAITLDDEATTQEHTAQNTKAFDEALVSVGRDVALQFNSATMSSSRVAKLRLPTVERLIRSDAAKIDLLLALSPTDRARRNEPTGPLQKAAEREFAADYDEALLKASDAWFATLGSSPS